jgi:LysR family transcriptional regulator, glycine cleavage system transcriptional activator
LAAFPAAGVGGGAVINRRWLPLNALRAFDAVGQRLSFTAGAQALGVSQSALSRHVIGLEELLGRQLLERKPHRLTLTEAGEVLLPVVQKSFDRLEQVLNTIRQGERTSRTLRIHLPPSLLNHLASPLLREFRADFPDLLIDVSSAALPSQDLDVAVVYQRPNVDDQVSDLLWMVRVTPVCTSEIAAQHAGKSLNEFLADNELLHVKLEGEPRGLLWSAFARQCGLTLDADRGLAFDTAISAAQFARSGAGVALVDLDMFAAELRSGELVAPFETSCENGYGYYLKFHPEDLGDPVIAAFRSWMIARFRGDAARRTLGGG